MAVADRLDRLHIFLLASGISFNVVLCLLPLLLVALYVAGSIVNMESVILSVERTLYDTLPATSSTQTLVQSIVEEIRDVQHTSSTAGLVGIGVLIWTSSALFSSLRTGLNAIFSISTPRFFLWYKVKDLFFTIVVALLLLVSVILTPATSLFASKVIALSPNTSWLSSMLMSLVASSVTAFIFFSVLLRFVPNKPQPLFIILRASLSSVILWEVARFAFTYYLEHIASFGRFYGTFSVLVASALWMYYSALIILISAEVAEYWYEQRQLARAKV